MFGHDKKKRLTMLFDVNGIVLLVILDVAHLEIWNITGGTFGPIKFLDSINPVISIRSQNRFASDSFRNIVFVTSAFLM